MLAGAVHGLFGQQQKGNRRYGCLKRDVARMQGQNRNWTESAAPEEAKVVEGRANGDGWWLDADARRCKVKGSKSAWELSALLGPAKQCAPARPSCCQIAVRCNETETYCRPRPRPRSACVQQRWLATTHCLIGSRRTEWQQRRSFVESSTKGPGQAASRGQAERQASSRGCPRIQQSAAGVTQCMRHACWRDTATGGASTSSAGCGHDRIRTMSGGRQGQGRERKCIGQREQRARGVGARPYTTVQITGPRWPASRWSKWSHHDTRVINRRTGPSVRRRRGPRRPASWLG